MGRKKVGIMVCLFVIAVSILFAAYGKDFFVKAEYSSEYNKIFGEFTAKTTSEFLTKDVKNSCYSPVSLYASFMLATNVTTGETREELLEMLGVETKEELEIQYNHMLKDIEVIDENSKIVLGNSLWLNSKNINNELKALFGDLESAYQCEFFCEDIIKSNEVNEWAEQKTEGLIKQIVGEDEAFSFFLANALYYKSKWAVNFDKMTNEKDFYLNNDSSVKTEFIETSSEKLNYIINDDYKYVEVPLDEGKLILVLPEKKELSKFVTEKNLNKVLALATSDDEKKNGNVIVKIPTFCIQDDIDSNNVMNVLEKLGVKQFFDEPEFIEGIEGMNARISQKTKFVVDEDGIEAAAVTSIGAEYSAKSGNVDLEITFDRPFMYILMKDGVPLFIGTVYNPAE